MINTHHKYCCKQYCQLSTLKYLQTYHKKKARGLKVFANLSQEKKSYGLKVFAKLSQEKKHMV